MSAANASLERRERLIAVLHERSALHDERVAAAFRAVPREIFLPGVDLDTVYSDEAIVTKTQDGVGISSSSQPAIMAIMLEQLDVRPGMRVLEIGAGTGYNAALLNELVGVAGHVTTVDIDEEVADWALERLTAAGYAAVEVHVTDGGDGWRAEAPYYRIELTVGVADISPAWIDQLVEGGVLVLPLQIHAAQAVIAFEKRGSSLISRSVQPGGFMPVRGRMAGRMHQFEVIPGVGVGTADTELNLTTLRSLLSEPHERHPWPGSLWDGFHFIAGLLGLPVIALWSKRDDLPFHRAAIGLLDSNPVDPGLAILTEDELGHLTTLLTFGSTTAADSLRRGYDRWEAMGQPAVSQLRIVAIPKTSTEPVEGIWRVETAWWQLHVTPT